MGRAFSRSSAKADPRRNRFSPSTISVAGSTMTIESEYPSEDEGKRSSPATASITEGAGRETWAASTRRKLPPTDTPVPFLSPFPPSRPCSSLPGPRSRDRARRRKPRIERKDAKVAPGRNGKFPLFLFLPLRLCIFAPLRSAFMKYICIHGHFYQPPRENPWLEAIEPPDDAAPSHA